MKLEYSRQFSKNTQIPNFMIIHPVGVKCFHSDRRTDKYGGANSSFSQFCKCT